MLTTVLSFLIVLGVLILVHELGHLWAAKAVDIRVPRFSIGFGPRVLGFRRGETEYVISALPLGGYVKMAGMDDMEAIEGEDDEAAAEAAARVQAGPGPRDYDSKTLGQRALVISAGVIMNFLFAALIFAFNGAVWGVPTTPDPRVGGVVEDFLSEGSYSLVDIPYGARVTAVAGYAVSDFSDIRRALLRARSGPAEIEFADAPPIAFEVPASDSLRAMLMSALEPMLQLPPMLASVQAGGPGDRAGLRAGDRIRSADGQPVQSWQQFVRVIKRSAGQPVPLEVERNGQVVDLEVTPAEHAANGISYGRIEVARPVDAHGGLPRDRVGPLAAMGYGARETVATATLIVDVVVGMLSGRHSPRSVGGPIMIGELSGQFARAGIEPFLNFMALISVNLAILNLLPIPVLDGGHLVFLAIEGVRGRPVSIEQRMRWSQVGLFIIFGLMIWAFGNDIARYVGF